MTDRVPVALLGATGAVGQRFVERLTDHPAFELAELVGDSSAGHAYGEAVNWILDSPLPDEVQERTVVDAQAPLESSVVFSALPSGTAGPIEARLSKAGKRVFTNAGDHRMSQGVPLVVPDLNPGHVRLVEDREGFIVANPNCSAIITTTALKPLHDAFGLEAVTVTTLQALSGAGYPGVASLDAVGNVVPFIGSEEEKIESEPTKILGRVDGSSITRLDVPISATATRVPVPEGHLCSLNVSLRQDASPGEVETALASYAPPDPVSGLPSAPERTVTVLEGEDRPQPRRDVMVEDGMGVAVGRVREDGNGTVKLVVLGSNTIRGAAGCSVLNAELAREHGLVS